MAAITLKDISKSYGAVSVVDKLSLEVNDGEFVVLVGPSGCGKSTLLRMIAGLLAPSSGEICIDGENVTKKAAGERDIAMVFQSYALYPHMSVYENIAFPLRVKKIPGEKIKTKVQHVADLLGLDGMLGRFPRELSGGQRQRVAMGRAIVREPKVFLFDEPLSNLDSGLRMRMRGEIAELHARLKTTMIYVTHDQHEAMTLASRLILLQGGKIAQQGAPLDVYNNPASRFVGQFMGSPPMNFFPGRWLQNGQLVVAEKTLPVRAHEDLRPVAADVDVHVGVRPEGLRLVPKAQASEGVGISAMCAWLEQTGSDMFVHCTVAGSPVVVRTSSLHDTYKPGDTLALTFTEARVFATGNEQAIGHIVWPEV